MHSLLTYSGLLLFVFIFVEASPQTTTVSYLEPGSSVETFASTNRLGYGVSSLRTYCYKGRPKYLAHLFQTIILQMDIETNDFVQYEGATPDEVQAHYESQKSMFSFNFMTNKKKMVHLQPFNQSCVGIETAEGYKVQLMLIRIDLYKIILLVAGIIVFFTAQRLSDNALFYYLCSILLGVFASFLILVYFVSKLLPRRPMMYGMMIGGWTLGIYFGQLLWDNLQIIIVTYQTYAIWYVIITGFLSFVICYRYGPPKNQRSINLIKWSLQLLAMIMIYFSSHFQEATVGINILIFIIYYFPKPWITKSKSYYRRRFPPKPRLLTREEFYEQGVKETTKALEQLRSYCASPECKQWSTMLRLKNPGRFASFMVGSSHVLDDEILEYESSIGHISDNDEDDNISDNDEQEVLVENTSKTNGYGRFLNRTRNEVILRSTPNTGSANTSRKRNIIYRQYDGGEISDDDN